MSYWGEEKTEAGVGNELTPARKQFLEQCREDPGGLSLYIWGQDPETGKPICRTLDAKSIPPIQPVPEWPYLPFVLERFRARPKVVVDKSRQLFCSWLLFLYFDYLALFRDFHTLLYNKSTMDEAKKVLFKRMGIIHQFWPQWFADWAQVSDARSEGQYRYGRTGSTIDATGENIEERAARGDQANVVAIDEAALHPRLREIVAAIVPMAEKIILISTPEVGPGGAYISEILSEGKEAA